MAHVFEGFFGLEDEPVKSVKMKVETRSRILWRLPHKFALCSYNFDLLSGTLLPLRLFDLLQTFGLASNCFCCH